MASIDNLLVSLLVDDTIGGFIITIPQGHIGCVYGTNGMLKKVWYPGTHFRIPLIYKVKLFNAQLIEYIISNDVVLKDNKEIMGDEVINAVTADNKFIAIEATVLIKLNAERLPKNWQDVGEDFISKVVRPVIRNKIRKALADHILTKALSTDRNVIEDEIKRDLRDSLAQNGLLIDNVYLSSLTPVEVTQPIESNTNTDLGARL